MLEMKFPLLHARKLTNVLGILSDTLGILLHCNPTKMVVKTYQDSTCTTPISTEETKLTDGCWTTSGGNSKNVFIEHTFLFNYYRKLHNI